MSEITGRGADCRRRNFHLFLLCSNRGRDRFGWAFDHDAEGLIFMAILPYSPRTLIWLGDTKETLSAYPVPVKRAFGFALRAVQNGETPPIAKPMKGLGSGVLELVHEFDKSAYRVVYALKIGTNVYVIDVFQKKSKTGSKTPREIKNRIEARLRLARVLEKSER